MTDKTMQPALLPPARLRQPGPPARTDMPPPRIHRDEARAVLGGAILVTLYDQASWSEGPIWWPREATLVWSDIVGRRVLGWREDGAVDVLLDATPFTNGNAVLPDGTLVHCEHGRRAISRSDGTGVATVIARHAEGKRLNAPNDLIVAADGAIWFSDPTFGLENPKQGVPGHSESGRTAICRIGIDGAARRMIDMAQPNGLAFSPDGRILYASQTPEHGEGEVAIFAFDWNGEALSNRRRLATVAEGFQTVSRSTGVVGYGAVRVRGGDLQRRRTPSRHRADTGAVQQLYVRRRSEAIVRHRRVLPVDAIAALNAHSHGDAME
ncbi:SMP-30/gluconolactonase/LRE family protein [Sphingomonas sp. I4]